MVVMFFTFVTKQSTFAMIDFVLKITTSCAAFVIPQTFVSNQCLNGLFLTFNSINNSSLAYTPTLASHASPCARQYYKLD
jgi:hypothetical protein